MRLPKDFREFIELLNSNHAEYVIVGGYALAFHGAPRYTGDIDVLVRSTIDLAREVSAHSYPEIGVTIIELPK